MGHSAAIYQLRVRRRRRKDDYLPFGDIDGKGTSLAQVMQNYISEIDAKGEDGVVLRFVGPLQQAGDEAIAVLEVGESGVTSWLAQPRTRTRRRQADTEFLKVGILMRLPKSADSGFMAIHVPNRRGTKGLLHSELRNRLSSDYRLILEVTPVLPRSALDEAIQSGSINQVRLVAIEQPADRFEDSQRWIEKEDLGRIEVVMHPKRLRQFQSRLLQRFQQDPSVINELVQFQGMTFDIAKVRFPLPSGGERTVNIEKPGSGHAMTIDLSDYHLALDDDGDPTDETLGEALRAVLDDAVSPET